MNIQSGVNYLPFTLNESITIDSPEFVLILVHDDTKKKYACKLINDISEYTERYNQYLVTVKTSANPLLSELNLETYGFHKYYVYEMADADSFDYNNVDDLVLSELEGEIEQGKIKYLKPSTTTPAFKENLTSIKSYVS